MAAHAAGDPRRLMIDSDILFVLGASGMLGPAIDTLGFDRSSSLRLPALANQVKRGRAFRRYPVDLRERALVEASAVPELTLRPAAVDALARLIRVDAIDEGEALMLALLVERPAWLLTSGDKRWMIAVAQATELRDLLHAVSGRIVCMETVLVMLLDRLGVRPLAQALEPLRPWHTTLRVAFPAGAETSERACREALESYLDDLQREVGEGVLGKP